MKTTNNGIHNTPKTYISKMSTQVQANVDSLKNSKGVQKVRNLPVQIKTKSDQINQSIHEKASNFYKNLKQVCTTIATETYNTGKRAVVGGGISGIIGGPLIAIGLGVALCSNPLLAVPVAIGAGVMATGAFTLTGATVGATLPVTKWLINKVGQKSREIMNLKSDLNKAQAEIKSLKERLAQYDT